MSNNVGVPRLRTVLLAAGAAALTARHLAKRRDRRAPGPSAPAAVPGTPAGCGAGSDAAGNRQATMVLTVAERTEIADGVVQLRLSGGYGADLPAWEPGAHLDLVLPSGLVRQYSLCGEPAEIDSYTIAARLAENSRGGSREVHEQLWEATEVEVRGPRNRFPLVEAPEYLFVAGGIGVTPLLPMLRAARSAGVPWRLVYGGRSRASMPFLAEIAALGGPDRVTVVPEDESGLPDLAGALAATGPKAAVYCCGPDGLMDAVTALCEERPPGGGLHLERFTPSAPRAADGSGDHAFEVELRRSGHVVRVGPGVSVLAAIREQALPALPYSCEQGYCGTCQQRVLAGEIDHRDELLTDSERDDSLLICVSRARGERLALDL
ncbi:PDR/VanB family oxidoreductase [Streptomyces sp. TRM 70351]|uniref:PDR/VanB family oxidoreductase n=1 Tax=Streptomyces sp. TRM 70351 TaxID=3116552 RepID=UPI002E7B2048|nr:PDR/VanB family oxidoreductase [Streptomyces sp. TRM 70351]MEE1928621.1 PDR/VanB family oxidoreductase [Streptomyces sp. TRM 70351]